MVSGTPLDVAPTLDPVTKEVAWEPDVDMFQRKKGPRSCMYVQ